MANSYGQQMALLRNNSPQQLPQSADVHGRVRVFNEKVTLAAQASGDTIEVGKLPKGARPLFGILLASATLGASATIAIGVSGTPAKYRAAAVFTSADTPTLFGVATNNGDALAAEEIVIITVGVAALPGSGTLRVMIFYVTD